MLQALIKNKLKDSFTDPSFRPSEDTLTSSVIGLMQFLPDNLFWYLFRQSCGAGSNLPENIGAIKEFYFWDRWSAKGTHNNVYVEPDVWIDTDKFYIIIEAKKTDYIGQHTDQWENEIKGLRNETQDPDKDVLFIALGGNDSLKDTTISIGKRVYNIYTASWFNLLHAVTTYISSLDYGEKNIGRILNNVVLSFSKHGYVDVDWLSSLKIRNICHTDILSMVEFDNHLFFRNMYIPNNRIKRHTKIWKEQKN